jgi:hypothetical protein
VGGAPAHAGSGAARGRRRRRRVEWRGGFLSGRSDALRGEEGEVSQWDCFGLAAWLSAPRRLFAVDGFLVADPDGSAASQPMDSKDCFCLCREKGAF